MCNLPATTLDSYVHKVMRGKILRRDHGKPPLVDEMELLRYSIREWGLYARCSERRTASSMENRIPGLLYTSRASLVQAGGNGLVPDISSAIRKLTVVSTPPLGWTQRLFCATALIEAAYSTWIYAIVICMSAQTRQFSPSRWWNGYQKCGWEGG